jgi:uncharacterized membrane protein (Fun14 family)
MVTDIGVEQITMTVGSGAVLGGVLGFAAKKFAKLAAFLVVLEVGLLTALERNGVLDVYWGELGSLLSRSGRAVESGVSGFTSLAGALPIDAGLTGGFLVGFKKG